MTDLADILNTRFALRRRLHDSKWHAYDGSIPSSLLTADKEPGLHAIISAAAAAIAADPDTILLDSYSPEERRRDWQALLAKTVLTPDASDVLPIDARSRPGHKLLDHYMRHFYDVANHTGRSVRQLASDPTAIARALLSNVAMHSTPYKSELRRMLTMTAGMSNVTKYRAVTAKAVVSYFGATRVLDPCIGWGGRMLGTLAAGPTTQFTGCEPDSRTWAGLCAIRDELPGAASRVSLLNAPAEVAIPALTAQYDMILTSPPYFNLEVYTTEPTQSVVTHPTWEDWRDNWLRPVVLAALARLAPGGVGTSCWSVKNFRTAGRLYPLADAVRTIHEDAGWVLVKTIKMTGSGRPGGGRIVGGKEGRVSEEETFCFKRSSAHHAAQTQTP